MRLGNTSIPLRKLVSLIALLLSDGVMSIERAILRQHGDNNAPDACQPGDPARRPDTGAIHLRRHRHLTAAIVVGGSAGRPEPGSRRRGSRRAFRGVPSLG